MTVKNLNQKEFDEFVKKGVVLIDYYANWCGPCRILSPVVESLSKEIKGIKFAKVDVDKESELAQRFYVMSIPTLIIFKDGEQVDRIVGAVPKEELEKRLEAIAKRS